MRTLMQISIPVEAGNQAARTGAFGPSFQKILESLKPEAAYFTASANTAAQPSPPPNFLCVQLRRSTVYRAPSFLWQVEGLYRARNPLAIPCRRRIGSAPKKKP